MKDEWDNKCKCGHIFREHYGLQDSCLHKNRNGELNCDCHNFVEKAKEKIG